jgi:hypothetical protein
MKLAQSLKEKPVIAVIVFSLTFYATTVAAWWAPIVAQWQGVTMFIVGIAALCWSPTAYLRHHMLAGATHVSDVSSDARTAGERPVLHSWQWVPSQLYARKGHELWVGTVVTRTAETTVTARVYGFGDRELKMLESAPQRVG